MNKKTICSSELIAGRSAEILGYVHDLDKDAIWGNLHFTRHNDTEGERLIPRADLRLRSKVRAVLDPLGVNYVDRDLEGIIAAHKIDSGKVEYAYSSVGWRSTGGFGFPRRVIKDGDRLIAPMPDTDGGLLASFQSFAGDLGAWNDLVAPAIAASSFALFAVGVAFAGPLLRYSGSPEGVTFAFSGQEGVGKTTCCVAAQAVMGSPDRHQLANWDGSRAGFKDLLGDVRDFTLVIDDTSRDGLPAADRLRFWADVGHAIAGGGKRILARSYQDRQDNAAARLPAIALTSGEIAPDELAKLTGASVSGGVKVRFIDIPVPPKSRGGIFDVGGANASSSRFKGDHCARALQDAIDANHGVAFGPYLDYLETHLPKLPDRIRRIEDYFLATIGRGSEQEQSEHARIARKFGLVLAGLKFARKAGALSVTDRQARDAVRVCFDAATGTHHDAGDERSSQTKRLRWILRDPVKVPRIQRGRSPAPNHLGFRRCLRGVEIAYMRADQIRDALGLDDRGLARLLSHLDKEGHLLPGTGGDRTRPVKVGDHPVRHYAFSAAFVGGAEKRPQRRFLIRRERPRPVKSKKA